MRSRWLVAGPLAALLGLLAVALTPGLAGAAGAAPVAIPTAPADLVALINADRAANGAGPLALRDDVSAIALAHSIDMAQRGTLFHNDGYFDQQVRTRLGASVLGENVALNGTVRDAHASLMNSPLHRANILDPRFAVVGIGVAQDADGHVWVTEDFLQPKPVVVSAAAAAPRPERATKPKPTARLVEPAPAAAAEPAPAPPALTAVPVAGPLTVEDAPAVLDTASLVPARSSVPLRPGGSGAVGWAAAVASAGLVAASGASLRARARRRPACDRVS